MSDAIAPAVAPSQAQPSPWAIDVQGLSKRLRDLQVLDDVHLQVARGTVVALLGHNGAGKSVLLRTLAGAILPDRGTVRVWGHDVVHARRAANAATGLVLGDEHAWYGRLSGQANLEFYAALRGLGRSEAGRAAVAGLHALGLEEKAGQPVSTYSTGMKARLAIARARLTDPPVLLLDEPSAGLDAQSRQDLHEDIARDPRTVLLTTHDVAEAAALADRVIILHRGRLMCELGAPIEADALASALARW